MYGGARRWAQVGVWYRRAGGCRGVTVAVDSYLIDCQEKQLRLGRGKVVRLCLIVQCVLYLRWIRLKGGRKSTRAPAQTTRSVGDSVGNCQHLTLTASIVCTFSARCLHRLHPCPSSFSPFPAIGLTVTLELGADHRTDGVRDSTHTPVAFTQPHISPPSIILAAGHWSLDRHTASNFEAHAAVQQALDFSRACDF